MLHARALALETVTIGAAVFAAAIRGYATLSIFVPRQCLRAFITLRWIDGKVRTCCALREVEPAIETAFAIVCPRSFTHANGTAFRVQYAFSIRTIQRAVNKRIRIRIRNAHTTFESQRGAAFDTFCLVVVFEVVALRRTYAMTKFVNIPVFALLTLKVFAWQEPFVYAFLAVWFF